RIAKWHAAQVRTMCFDMTKAKQSISHVIADDERAAAPTCRFSVIVPAYNRAALLPRCLDSLRGQTFDDFEVIVVDDGSTDATPELVAEYVRREGRIRSLRQDNAGAATARNRGAETARGDYLLFLD